jgi:hypothetical protein
MLRIQLNYTYRGRCGHDRMVVGFTTNYAISAYHHCCELEFRSWRGVLDTTLCVKVCQWLTAGRWFSPGTTVSPTNKTDCNDINEILLEVALTSMTLTLTYTAYQGLKIPQVRRPGLENLNFGLAVFPWKKPIGHAFNKIKTPLFSKRHVFNSNHMQVFVNCLLSL